MKKILQLLLLMPISVFGQFDFCTGSKGDPIFLENFGSGTTFGPELPAGTTTYTYIAGTPNDGQYTLYYQTNLNSSWHNSSDHTTDINGKALIVNASYSAGEFFRRSVTGLCVNTNFEFTAWLMNVYNSSTQGACGGSGIPVDVTFEIWDATETTLLESGSTGPINGTSNAQWRQYGLTFNMPAGQSSVVLKMLNNGAGGCGNDLAIDDIMFRSCGDLTTISSPQASGTVYTSCSGSPETITMNLSISGSGPHAQQWQESTDNANWTDIPGATMTSFTTPPLSALRYFRVKVAQDATNLANPFCHTVSDVFTVQIVNRPNAPTNPGDITQCNNVSPYVLTAIPAVGEAINWFDAPTGGNLLLANSNTYSPTSAGTYYAEAAVGNCTSNTRTPITLSLLPAPQLTDETADVCVNQTVTLDAAITGVTYLWDTGETTQAIQVSAGGNYVVRITTPNGCFADKTFTVNILPTPIIKEVQVDDDRAEVIIEGSGAYEYSLDGISFQTSPVFDGLENGLYTVFVRGNPDCDPTSENFAILVFPKFFTPNGDGFNDFFQLPAGRELGNPSIYIFDRFGMLITIINADSSGWNGIYNGNSLPSTDYWYRAVFAQGKEIKGHFSLKR